MKPRLLVLLLACLAFVFLTPKSAGAHAVLRSSVPPAGARVEQTPQDVLITFSEPPEPSFSSIEVLDSSGRSRTTGRAEIVSGMPLTLRVRTPDLATGTFTVSWRAFSRVDGHTTTGTFTFGVGVSPSTADATTRVEEGPRVSSEELVGRWIFYLGLVALLGTALAGSFVFRTPPASTRRLLGAALVLSFIGLTLLADAQRKAAGVEWEELFSVFTGRAVIWRAMGLFPAALLVLLPKSITNRRISYLVVAAGIAATMLVHSMAGHAAASQELPRAQIAFQWIHLLAVGVWIGGLAALIAGIRGEPDEERVRAVKRFSLIAGFALFAVASTGVLRALNSLNRWGDLLSTPYGVTVSIKSGLWIALAALGGVNRFRNVPVAQQTLRGLRLVSRWELALAAIAIGAAAMLASSAPPASQPVAGPTRRISVSGSDFATSMKARLEVSPGTPGPNRFVLRLSDYDSGEPIDATAVILRLSNLDDAGLGESTLELAPGSRGSYQASGSNLSVPGRWRVVAVVQERGDATEIPLRIATRCGTTASEVKGQPTVYTIDFPTGVKGQGYLEPGRAGFNEVHLTFFDPQGSELEVPGASLYAARGTGPRLTLQSRRLGPGHFVADAQLPPGRWRFDFRSEGSAEALAGCFESRVQETANRR